MSWYGLTSNTGYQYLSLHFEHLACKMEAISNPVCTVMKHSLVCTSEVIVNDLVRRLKMYEYGHFYGLFDSEGTKLSTSDEEADAQGEPASSIIMPEMRLTIDSGYCLVFRE